jgi:hypothetical protein
VRSVARVHGSNQPMATGSPYGRHALLLHCMSLKVAISAAPTSRLRVRYWESSCRAAQRSGRQLMTDAVEKGKNELIEFFTCAPVETVILPSNASQRAYEGCWLEIGLIMCPPTSFSGHRTSASEKICSAPQKDFFNSIGP